ncbi:class I SAM-dependent methyltransferase [Ferruginivarius sediminum]|uniref:Class I SAM-dependent methyltransferase n=1 Tax=Ferruginivarius sediminum TaxID=2661937 RepID=A0A369TFV1_9PROT|nr:class I SAM-dependent methyltransferase [Ferruginivarius sediminum]RDD62997.1 class I SAM-dependent methyltransferase [Ferruginivarius sediminum]
METEQGKIEAIATAYRQSCVLFAAIELGIWGYFEDRADPVSVQDLATAINLDKRAAHILVNCLCEMRILEIEPDGRIGSPLIRSLGGQDAQSGILNYLDELKEWMRLSEKIVNKDGEYRENRTFATEEIEPYLDMVKLSNAKHAPLYIEVVADKVGAVHSALDIGGGHGLYSELLLGKYPEAYATLMDLPAAIAYLNKRLRTNIAERLTLVEGDAREKVAGHNYDLVMINDMLHSYSYTEKEKIIVNAVESLRPGGWLVCGKYYLDDEDIRSPLNNHFFSLKMLLNTEGGYLESNQEVEALMRRHGLSRVETVFIPHEIPSVAQFGFKE